MLLGIKLLIMLKRDTDIESKKLDKIPETLRFS